MLFRVLISIEIQIDVSVCMHVSLCNHLSHVLRLVHQDGSLADLTILSASSVEVTLSREEQDRQEEQGEQGEWRMEEKEKDQTLVVVMDDNDITGEKPRSFSDPRQSSTEESHHCSAGTEPEPSTEQSSGTTQVIQTLTKHMENHSRPNLLLLYHSIFLTIF